MEDIKTELPNKLLSLMKIFIQKIKTSWKDEYGDIIFDMDIHSLEMNEIREIAYLLSNLLKKLFIQTENCLMVF